MHYITPEIMIYEYNEDNIEGIIWTSDGLLVGDGKPGDGESSEDIWSPPF